MSYPQEMADLERKFEKQRKALKTVRAEKRALIAELKMLRETIAGPGIKRVFVFGAQRRQAEYWLEHQQIGFQKPDVVFVTRDERFDGIEFGPGTGNLFLGLEGFWNAPGASRIMAELRARTRPR